jgi:WD40 repeat protein/regulator of protease activity HflC (stomatin/prohibitin superfamily)
MPPIPRNPYIAGKALGDPRGFFGRADVFGLVQTVLSSPDQNSVVLFGQRRIGKTSILLNLRSQLPAPPFVPVYFDLMDRARKSLATVSFELAATIAQEIHLPQPRHVDFADEGRGFREKFLPTVYTTLGDRRLVLLFDEFDVLTIDPEEKPAPNSAASTFFPYLRDLMINEPRLGFVFVVGRRAEELSAEFKSAFKTSRFYRVSVLDDRSARALVRTAESNNLLHFNDASVARILELTAQHPFFTQLTCQLLFEQAYQSDPPVKNITPATVDAVAAKVLEAGEAQFEWIWDGLPPAERMIFSAVASGTDEQSVVTEERLQAILQDQGIRTLIREMELAAKKLVEWEMLKQTDGGYKFFVELMRRWVVTRKHLDKMKDELDRIVPLADAWYQIADKLHQRNDLTRAIKHLDSALEANPNHLKARLLLGEIYRKQGKNDAAVRELEKAFDVDKEVSHIALEVTLLQRADSLEKRNKTDESLRDYERVLTISPHNKVATDRRDAILRKRGNRELRNRIGLGITCVLLATGVQFFLIRLLPVPSALLIIGTIGILALAIFQVIRPWLQQRRGKTVPSYRFYIYLSITATIALGISSTLFYRFSETHISSQLLSGHTTRINTIIISPNAEKIASSGIDSLIYIWNSQTYQAERRIASEETLQFTFSRDATKLISISRDRMIRIWSVSDGVLQREGSWKQYDLTSVAANSAEPNWIAVGNANGQVRLWQLENDTAITISAYTDPVRISSLAFNPKGTLIATGGDRSVRLLTYKGDLVNELKTSGGQISDIVFSPDGKTLAALSANATVTLWSFNDDSAAVTAQTITLDSPGFIDTMLFTNNGQTLLTGGDAQVLRVWNVADGKLIDELPYYAQSVKALGILKDPNANPFIIALASTGNEIRIWFVGNSNDIEGRWNQYWLSRFFLGSEPAQLYWATILGIAGAIGSILLFIGAYTAGTAGTIYGQYPGFDFIPAWRMTFNVELGIHQFRQVVATGEVKTSPAVSSLGQEGGPGVLIVEEGHAAVLMASGKVTRIVGDGITWLSPFERVHMVVYLPVRVEKVVALHVITRDMIVLENFELLVFHRVDRGNGSGKSGHYSFDSKIILEKIWSPKGSDWRESVSSISQTAIRDVIAQFRFEDIVSVSGIARQELSRLLTDKINQITQNLLGVQVITCNIGEIKITGAAKEALERKVLAEVERQTQIITAEAEKEVLVRRGEGEALRIRRVEQQLAEMFRSTSGKELDADTAKRYMDMVERILALDKIASAEGTKTIIVGDVKEFADSENLESAKK